jgi:hypothetical protein
MISIPLIILYIVGYVVSLYYLTSYFFDKDQYAMKIILFLVPMLALFSWVVLGGSGDR